MTAPSYATAVPPTGLHRGAQHDLAGRSATAAEAAITAARQCRQGRSGGAPNATASIAPAAPNAEDLQQVEEQIDHVQVDADSHENGITLACGG